MTIEIGSICIAASIIAAILFLLFIRSRAFAGFMLLIGFISTAALMAVGGIPLFVNVFTPWMMDIKDVFYFIISGVQAWFWYKQAKKF